MQKMYLILLLLLTARTGFAVEFENIRNRKISQYELAHIIIDLSQTNSLSLLNRWVELCPSSFKNLNFTKAYLIAAENFMNRASTNQALVLYIKSYQALGKNNVDKIQAAYHAAFILYSQRKRSEALFYINRAIEALKKIEAPPSLVQEIFSLKRRIIWRYFSRLEFLPDNAVSAIAFDEDEVWIGMWSGGVARFSRSSFRLSLFNAHNSKLTSLYVRDILVHNDKIWVATHCGLSYYQKSTSSWHNVPAFKNLKLKRIRHDGAYFIVATLFKGVFRSRDGISWENIVPRKNVLDILEVKQDLYIATAECGVFLYNDKGTQKFLSGIAAKTIIQDRNPHYLWIGTYGDGLLKVNRNTAKIVQKFSAKEINSDYVESLLLVDDKLWIGTLEAGVRIYDIKKKSWQKLGLRDGLPGLDIMTITRENEFLWFGTLAGGIGIYLFQEQLPNQGVSLD